MLDIIWALAHFADRARNSSFLLPCRSGRCAGCRRLHRTPDPHRAPVFRAYSSSERCQFAVDFLQRGRFVDVLERRRHRLHVFGQHVAQGHLHQMHDARLRQGLWKHRVHRLRQTLQAIHAGYIDVLHAEIPQLVQSRPSRSFSPRKFNRAHTSRCPAASLGTATGNQSIVCFVRGAIRPIGCGSRDRRCTCDSHRSSWPALPQTYGSGYCR